MNILDIYSFWQFPNRCPNPGLGEKSFFVFCWHSGVLEGLYSILKSFETHLELIFDVPAMRQCEVIGFCVFT